MTRGTSRLPLGAGGFLKLLPVSRETFDRLGAYVDLLTLWNRRINLVGRDSICDVWRRHILDSAQLYGHIPRDTRVLVDLGSGAGLPGLILAIMGARGVHLIESDGRKAVFLREAARITETPVEIHAQRLDRVPPFTADVVTARALAPLAELLSLSQPFRRHDSLCLFLKGRSSDEELTEANKSWNMRVHRSPSLSDAEGCVLRLENIARDPRAAAARDDRT